MAGRFGSLVGKSFQATQNTGEVRPNMDAEAGRVPACLVIDTSGSMNKYSEQLRKAAIKMIEAVGVHGVAGEKVDLEVITFNTIEQIAIKIEAQELFNLVENGKLKNEYVSRLDFKCNGGTPTGYALKVAVSELRHRYETLKECGKTPCSPILFVLSDGLPEVAKAQEAEHERILAEAITEIRSLVSENRLVVIAVEIGIICEEPKDDWSKINYPKMHKLMQDITGLNDTKHVRQAKDAESLAKFFEFTSTLLVHSATSPNDDLNKRDLSHAELC